MRHHHQSTRQGRPLPPDLLVEARVLTERLGSDLRVAIRTGLSRVALARALAGLPVVAGTRAAIELWLRDERAIAERETATQGRRP
jgi:hypothetical protein